MPIEFQRLQPSLDERVERAEFERDVLEGLARTPKSLPCKWLYDARGSALIGAIMDLEEYTLTRAESEIFERHKEALRQALGENAFDVIDLGAGDGRKTAILLEHFQRSADVAFYSIDISAQAGRDLAASFSARFPRLRGAALAAEYDAGLAWIGARSERRKLVLFLGSNIGNLSALEARTFLVALRNALSPGDFVLVGFDLRKELEVMRRAYDDSRGVTAEFNLNLLARMNRELHADFDLERFRFYCTWEPRSSAIESYLVSTCEQSVRFADAKQSVRFQAFEALHTESSRKYGDDDVRELAQRCGLECAAWFRDSANGFVDVLLRVGGQ